MTAVQHVHKGWTARLGLGLLPLLIGLSPQLTKPSPAADKITFSLGATVERSISLNSIELYVEEGIVTEELAPYLAYIEPEALAQARALLTQRADIDVLTVAQFAYTPQGEFLLAQAGEVFRTGARLPGGKGLRSAAILSAADEAEGLTILNVLRRFPTPTLRIDLPSGLAFTNQATEAFNHLNAAITLVEQISLQTATEPFPEGTSAAELSNLINRAGPYKVSRLPIRIKASFKPVDVYLPEAPAPFLTDSPFGTPGKYPAVIISHGLGSDRNSYAYLAEFLAARGFAAITLEHPGTNAEQLDAFVAGRVSQIPDEEFVNRPALISQVLNGLAERAVTDKNLQFIDFNNVAAIGQSFGGYTALAVAGAPIDFMSLNQVCPPRFSINISLLLQCQAAALVPPQTGPNPTNQNFKDPRIRAVIAINPIASTVFGPNSLAQVDVPTFIMAGSADTVAPALPEQILPFTWLSQSAGTTVAFGDGSVALPAENRYLMVMEGGTHFSTIGVTGAETFGLPSDIIGPAPEIAQSYTQTMSLAFLQVYLYGDTRYRPILTSAFTTRLSRPEMPLSLISSLTAEQLITGLGTMASLETEKLQAAALEALQTVEADLATNLETNLDNNLENSAEAELGHTQKNQ